ncbi:MULTISPECIES: hypothetical protein [unclassified Kitasatospora]|uniref:hypothetical protein n=1 Tax=unclassified Kitasatospora TaxID=2633591 RepID=UPI003436E9FC
MTVAGASSVFAAVARYFDNPRAQEVRLTLHPNGEPPVLLSPAQARDAIYGTVQDPALVTEIWRAALRAAQTEHGPAEEWRLLLVWLALPRLTGTAFRICHRMRADRADVEAEMVLGLLEGLRTGEPPSALSVDALLKAVCSRAWRLARAGRHETACATLEQWVDDSGGTAACDGPEEDDQVQQPQVEVTRHERVGGLRAQLRFTISPERLSQQALTALTEEAERQQLNRRARHVKRQRHANSASPHRGARHL